MFCTNPFNHMDVVVANENILIQPCNVWTGKKLSIDEYKKEIKNIQSILSTKFHDGCNTCLNEEKNKIRSRRQAINKFHVDNDLSLDKIQSLGVRYGTLCNSKCIICSHSRSSSWVADSLALGYEVESKYHFKKNQMPGIDFFFNEFDLSDLKYVEFHGGEPLIQTYPLEFLEKIKNLEQLVVKFNTNLTVLPSQQLQEILKKCKRVDFLISVDDIEERYEILRYPAKWKNFNQNLNEIKKLNHRVFSYNCISSLNIWYMPEFYEWAIKTFEMNIHSQFVTDTDFLDISNLNKNIKEQCLNKIKNYKGKLFDSIRNKLIQENKVTHNIMDDFQKYLSKLDKIRSTDYFGTFKEWWKIIKE